MLEGNRNFPSIFARRTCLTNGSKAGKTFERKESFFVAVLHRNFMQGSFGTTYSLAPTPTPNNTEKLEEILYKERCQKLCALQHTAQHEICGKGFPKYYPGTNKGTASEQALHHYITIANHSRPFHTAPNHCQPSSLCHGPYPSAMDLYFFIKQ